MYFNLSFVAAIQKPSKPILESDFVYFDVDVYFIVLCFVAFLFLVPFMGGVVLMQIGLKSIGKVLLILSSLFFLIFVGCLLKPDKMAVAVFHCIMCSIMAIPLLLLGVFSFIKSFAKGESSTEKREIRFSPIIVLLFLASIVILILLILDVIKIEPKNIAIIIFCILVVLLAILVFMTSSIITKDSAGAKEKTKNLKGL